MTQDSLNPFDVTKAVDFDDLQIRDYWVDLPGGPGFRDLVKPTSPMPMLVLGGKGSGKTHLLRFFSYPLQKLRHTDPMSGIRDEGYVGVYLRCGGLNASRFCGKGQGQDAWTTVFQQYMDIWLAQLFLGIVGDVLTAEALQPSEGQLCASIVDLFDVPPPNPPQTLSALLGMFREWQRTLDIAINNAAITRRLDTPIHITPGRLVFGIPQAFSKTLKVFKGIQVLYLLDELENLDETQQRYVNTLIREKEAPCSFKVGARMYGVRTYETYSAGEINREGSEYEKLHLDDHLRANKSYGEFALRLCARRLIEANYLADTNESTSALRKKMGRFFEEPEDPLTTPDRFLVRVPNQSKGRPYFVRLQAQLREGLSSGHAPGVRNEADIRAVLDALKVAEAPLVEKANLLLLYKAWSKNKDLIREAQSIHESCALHLSNPKSNTKIKKVLSHFGGDLAAQLLFDYGMKQQYVGFDTFVEMSRGLPRNLLVVLKHVFQWASFNGELPFRESAISVASQQQGVNEASRWFFRDAEVLGEDGPNVQTAIRRLADLFRAIRFADKPAECSLSTFAVNFEAITPRSRELIGLAERWSLLFRIAAGQRDRNSSRLNTRFQLNSMICPMWDLPIYRRGTLALTPAEVNAVFDPGHSDDYDRLSKIRIARMTAPSFGHRMSHEPSTLLNLTQ